MGKLKCSEVGATSSVSPRHHVEAAVAMMPQISDKVDTETASLLDLITLKVDNDSSLSTLHVICAKVGLVFG